MAWVCVLRWTASENCDIWNTKTCCAVFTFLFRRLNVVYSVWHCFSFSGTLCLFYLGVRRRLAKLCFQVSDIPRNCRMKNKGIIINIIPTADNFFFASLSPAYITHCQTFKERFILHYIKSSMECSESLYIPGPVQRLAGLVRFRKEENWNL